MELNRLRQFQILAQTGHLRKASEILRISPSGLSQSIKVLERELGLQLVQTKGRNLTLTDSGQRVLEKIPNLLEGVSGFLESIKGHSTKENRGLRIGSFEVFTSFFVGPLVRNFLPGVEIDIYELTPGELEEKILKSQVDLGITYEPVAKKGIAYTKVATTRMAAYKLRHTFQRMNFSEIPFVVPAPPLEGSPSAVRGEDGWPREHFERKIHYRVDLMTTGLELVRQGLCAIFIPEFIAHQYNARASADQQLSAMPLPENFPSVRRPIYIVRRDSQIEDKIVRQVAKALRQETSSNPSSSW